MTANELADEIEDIHQQFKTNYEVCYEPIFEILFNGAANMLRQQAQEINNLKKQITQLSVSREPKIGDRVILIDDESEGVIVSLSIGGNAAINFDDGCYGNYTKVELITLFAYKESE